MNFKVFPLQLPICKLETPGKYCKQRSFAIINQRQTHSFFQMITASGSVNDWKIYLVFGENFAVFYLLLQKWQMMIAFHALFEIGQWLLGLRAILKVHKLARFWYIWEFVFLLWMKPLINHEIFSTIIRLFFSLDLLPLHVRKRPRKFQGR